MNKAIFLDRDGVINRAIVRQGRPYAPKTWSELEILPGVYDALTALQQADFLLIVVSNQPDVARGHLERSMVEAMNQYLSGCLPLTAFHICYHRDEDRCACRKPAPGALLSAAQSHHISLSESYMIGDRWKDIEAGKRAGCRTMWIDYGYKEPQPTQPDYCVHSLLEAAAIILGE